MPDTSALDTKHGARRRMILKHFDMSTNWHKGFSGRSRRSQTTSGRKLEASHLHTITCGCLLGWICRKGWPRRQWAKIGSPYAWTPGTRHVDARFPSFAEPSLGAFVESLRWGPLRWASSLGLFAGPLRQEPSLGVFASEERTSAFMNGWWRQRRRQAHARLKFVWRRAF